jgi:hypothetical protein
LVDGAISEPGKIYIKPSGAHGSNGPRERSALVAPGLFIVKEER